MNSNDFYDWKSHPVTQAVFGNLKERINVLTEELVEQLAFSTHEAMAEKAGAIKAIQDVLSISFEDEE